MSGGKERSTKLPFGELPRNANHSIEPFQTRYEWTVSVLVTMLLISPFISHALLLLLFLWLTSLVKNEDPVDIPFDNLDLSPYCDGYNNNNNNSNNNGDNNVGSRMYELISVSCHSGNLGAGHYKAVAKHNNTW